MSNFTRVSVGDSPDDARQIEQDKRALEQQQPSQPRDIFANDTVSVGHVGNIESARVPMQDQVLVDIPDENITAFPDQATMLAWMADPRYRTSAAYQAIVHRRIAKTPF